MSRQIRQVLRKELKIWLLAIAIGIFSALAITHAYAANVQNEISDNVIRFHVLSHSAMIHDIMLKNEVRDGILEYFTLDADASIEDSRAYIADNLGPIEERASDIVKRAGFDYPVQVLLDRTFFPTRTYGHMAFPAGQYEALRIVIGEGEGGNWWCVMFPPLCYIDVATSATATSIDSSSDSFAFSDYTLLSSMLSYDAYSLMNHENGVTVRFKIVEWWQERMNESQESQERSAPIIFVLH